jgi:hypothetical protein
MLRALGYGPAERMTERFSGTFITMDMPSIPLF